MSEHLQGWVELYGNDRDTAFANVLADCEDVLYCRWLPESKSQDHIRQSVSVIRRLCGRLPNSRGAELIERVQASSSVLRVDFKKEGMSSELEKTLFKFALENRCLIRSQDKFMNGEKQLLLEGDGRFNRDHFVPWSFMNNRALIDTDMLYLDEGVSRKARNEELMRSEGFLVDAQLPPLPPVKRELFRSITDCCKRAIALKVVGMKGEGLASCLWESELSLHAQKSYFTEEEWRFLNSQYEPPIDGYEEEDDFFLKSIRYSWSYESLWTILWALGYVVDLGRPDHCVHVEGVLDLMRNHGSRSLKSRALPRERDEVLDALDLSYRYYYLAKEALSVLKRPQGNIDLQVAEHRVKALIWVAGAKDWDELTKWSP